MKLAFVSLFTLVRWKEKHSVQLYLIWITIWKWLEEGTEILEKEGSFLFFIFAEWTRATFFLSSFFLNSDAWDVLDSIRNSPPRTHISIYFVCIMGCKKFTNNHPNLKHYTPTPPGEQRRSAPRSSSCSVSISRYRLPQSSTTVRAHLPRQLFLFSIYFPPAPFGWAGPHPATRVELLMPGEAERWFHCVFRCSGWMAFRGGCGDWRRGGGGEHADEEGEPLWRINIAVCRWCIGPRSPQCKSGLDSSVGLPLVFLSRSHLDSQVHVRSLQMRLSASSSSSCSITLPFVDDEMTACSRFASQLRFSGDSLGSRRQEPALIGG